MSHLLWLALTSIVLGCRVSALRYGSRRPEQDIWPHLCCGLPPSNPLLDRVPGRTVRQEMQLLSAVWDAASREAARLSVAVSSHVPVFLHVSQQTLTMP